MSGSEARLSDELQAAGGQVRRLGENMLLLQGVPTDPARFSKPLTNLLVVLTGRPQMPYLVLVDDDLRYGGEDPFLVRLFSDQPRSAGWRPLLLAPAHMTQSEIALVARRAAGFLGFPRTPPRDWPAGLSDDWGFREAFPPLVGRATLLAEAEAASDAVVFVGPAGVGKSALLRELAWRWRDAAPDRTAVSLATSTIRDELSSDTRTRQLRGALEEVLRLGTSALLLIDGLHHFWAGPAARLILRDALERGLRLVATAPASPPAFFDPALARRLRVVSVTEPSREQLLNDILPTVARYLEVRHGLSIAPETLAMAVRLGRRRAGAEPGKTAERLEAALTRARDRGLSVLGPDDVLPEHNSE